MTATLTAEKRILVVEDEAIVALDIQSQLESLGYEVVGVAPTSARACELAEAKDPDLVLMDIHLAGGEDGITAAEKICAHRSVPIVFVTAFVDKQTLERAKVVGPYGYIVKPFDKTDLHTTIQMALAKGASDRELFESHDTLLTILDTQRQGTVSLDANGRCDFLSRAARQFIGLAAATASGRPWRDVLPLASAELDKLAASLKARPSDRKKTVVHFEHPDAPSRVVEVDVQDDPRSAGGKLLFLYDVSQLHGLRRMLEGQAVFESMIGKSAPMQHVFSLIRDFAKVDSTVLIEGETGTGKELVARALHACSRRADKPFVALNCAGLSEELAVSQLFGHRRGAFTGAVEDHAGLFEAAEGGTLLLDELGELSQRVQTMLLRALEERQVMRIGETKLRPINVRVVAATNRDLSLEVAAQRFRADLLYRIRVAPIRLPRLAERREDIPLLSRQFIADHAAMTGKAIEQISDAALGLLMGYDWPGNVRELRNALEFAVIRCPGSTIEPTDLPPEVQEAPQMADLLESLSGDERAQIMAALERARGNRKEAAQLLGISRATFYRRLDQLGIGEKGTE